MANNYSVSIDLKNLSSSQDGGNIAELSAITGKMLGGLKVDWGVNDAPLIVFLGQSNSVGLGTSLAAADASPSPLANVYGLKAEGQNINKNATDVTWSNFRTGQDFNLGADNVGAVTNVQNQFAKLWQAHIAAGNTLKLPNLYTIQIARSNSAVYQNQVNHWWSVDEPLSDPKTSFLYAFAMKTLSLAISNLKAQGKNPRIIGVHWNQWENDGTPAALPHYHKNLIRIFTGVRDALESPFAPITMYYAVGAYSRLYLAPGIGGLSANATIRKIQEDIVLSVPNVDLLDARQRAGYVAPPENPTGQASNNQGDTYSDDTHFRAPVHKWFAEQTFAKIEGGLRGAFVGLSKRVEDLLSASASTKSLFKNVFTFDNLPATTTWDKSSPIPGATMLSGNTFTYRIGESNGKKFFGIKRDLGVNFDLFKFDDAPSSNVMNGELIFKLLEGSVFPSTFSLALRIGTKGVVGTGYANVPYSYMNVQLILQDGVYKAACYFWYTEVFSNDAMAKVVWLPIATNAYPTNGGYVKFRVVNGSTIQIYTSADGFSWIEGFNQKVADFYKEENKTATNLFVGGDIGFMLGANDLTTDYSIEYKIEKIEYNVFDGIQDIGGKINETLSSSLPAAILNSKAIKSYISTTEPLGLAVEPTGLVFVRPSTGGNQKMAIKRLADGKRVFSFDAATWEGKYLMVAAPGLPSDTLYKKFVINLAKGSCMGAVMVLYTEPYNNASSFQNLNRKMITLQICTTPGLYGYTTAAPANQPKILMNLLGTSVLSSIPITPSAHPVLNSGQLSILEDITIVLELYPKTTGSLWINCYYDVLTGSSAGSRFQLMDIEMPAVSASYMASKDSAGKWILGGETGFLFGVGSTSGSIWSQFYCKSFETGSLE